MAAIQRSREFKRRHHDLNGPAGHDDILPEG